MKRLTLVTLVVLLGSLTGSAQQNAAEQQPFPPLTPQAKLQLQQVLLKWGKTKPDDENARMPIHAMALR